MKQQILLSLLLTTVLICSCNTSQEPAVNGDIEVTLTEGTNMAVALSPDKKTLAMALQGTIWILSADGGEAIDITDEMGDSHEPAWSPDGNRIAFHSYRNGNYHIWTINKDGSDLQQITGGIFDDREPDWSPDGGYIVFSSDRNGTYDLWQVDLNTGELEQLTFHESNDYNPAFSPDGDRIAYVSQRDKAGIYVLENGEEKIVAPSPFRLTAPSWSEDGNRLLFAAYTRGRSYMYLTDITTDITADAMRKVSSEEEDIFPFRPNWLSNDSFIYTADGKIKKRFIGEEDVEVIPFEAGFTLNRPSYERKKYDFDDSSARTPIGIMGPVVSPDGNKIAFTALGDIYIQEIGGEITQITNDPYVNLDPDWSPDGRKVAFISDRGGKMEIWIQDLHTGEERLLTTEIEEPAAYPAWSADGSKVAFYTTSYRGKWGPGTLNIADVRSGEVTPVHESVFVPGKASWSPDNTTLAMMALNRQSRRFREGFNNFLLVSLDGGTSRFVSPDTTDALSMRNNNGPVWSPDGSSFAFVQNGVLWTVPANESGDLIGSPRQITHELADNLSWTGDSRSLVYIATDRLKKVEVESGNTKEIDIDLQWRPQLPEEDYIIHAGKLFNGLDSTYVENVDILVSGNRIQDITPHQENRRGKVIDASDKVVIPGLFEMHSHQNSSAGQKLGKIWLSYGITSVRDPGSDPYDSLERKESWTSGVRPGPRLFFTGGLTSGGRIYYGLSHSVTEPSHVRMELERAKKLDYDFIKTYVRMPDYLQKELTEGAHALGIPVSSHELYPAAKYNVDSIEHLAGTSRRGYSLKLTANHGSYGDVSKLIARSAMSITPTSVMRSGFLRMAVKYDELLNHEQFKAFHSTEYMRGWADQVLQSEFDSGSDILFEGHQATLAGIFNAGGRITSGTDSPFVPFGSSLHAELWLYVEAGMTPFQALQAATIHAAEAVGVENDLGTIEPGKVADLVIVNGDPLYQIRDAINVRKVIKNGIVYSVDELMNFMDNPDHIE